jgi:hypothetical protein
MIRAEADVGWAADNNPAGGASDQGYTEPCASSLVAGLVRRRGRLLIRWQASQCQRSDQLAWWSAGADGLCGSADDGVQDAVAQVFSWARTRRLSRAGSGLAAGREDPGAGCNYIGIRH